MIWFIAKHLSGCLTLLKYRVTLPVPADTGDLKNIVAALTGLQHEWKSVIFEAHDQVLHGEHVFPSDVKKFSDGGLVDKGKYFGPHFDWFSDKDAPDIAGTELIFRSRSDSGIAHADQRDSLGISVCNI